MNRPLDPINDLIANELGAKDLASTTEPTPADLTTALTDAALLDDSAADVPLPSPKKPMSQARLEANRRNAQKSTGPRTPEGRRRSSLNATRIYITGQIACLPAEDLAQFRLQCAAVLEYFAPVGPIETFFANAVAENMWRLNRARALENGILSAGASDLIDTIQSSHPDVDALLAQSLTWHREPGQFSLLTVYEGRISRAFHRDLAALKELQAARKLEAARARKQAEIFVVHAESNGEVYEPGTDFEPAEAYGGFVFSLPEVHRRRDREQRLLKAFATYEGLKTPAAMAA